MDNSFRVATLGSLMGVILLSFTVPTAQASTEGPLEQLGDMLGFGSDENIGNNDGTMETARGNFTLQQSPAEKPTNNLRTTVLS